MSVVPSRVVALSCGAVLLASLGACTEAPARLPSPAAPAAIRPDPRASAAPLLAEVFTRIDQHDSARTTVRGNLGALGELTSEGVVSYADRSADLELNGRLWVSETQENYDVEMAMVDDVGYLHSEVIRAEPGKPWLRVTPGAHDFASRLVGPAVEQIQDSADPRLVFAGIETTARIQASGPDQLDGATVTRYELRIPTSHASHPAAHPRQRALLRRAADGGRSELSYQLWLDQGGLPVRFTTTRHVDRAGEVSLTATFHDWGVGAEIIPPPAEQTGLFKG